MPKPLLPALRRILPAAYPAALAAAYVLTKYLDEGLPLVTGLRASLVAALMAVALTALAVVVLADLRRGALLGAALVVLILTLHEPRMGETLAVAVGAILVERLLAFHPRIRDGVHIRVLHGLLPVFSIVLLVLTVARFPAEGGLGHIPPADAVAGAVAGDPDIWFVILDGHPRRDVLAEVYDWHDPSFFEGLERLGFAVAPHSRSNYLNTRLTLRSMLNLSLLDRLYPPKDEEWRELQRNRAFAILRERGYGIIAVGSGFTYTELRSADRFLDAGAADLIELQVLAETGLRYVVDALMPTFATGQVRARIEHNLRRLSELAREPSAGPRFIWVHLPAPHAPSVYARDGSTLPARLDGLFFDTEPGGSADDHRDRFVGNLAYFQGLMLAAIGDLMSATRGEAVVIVMSDHGSRSRGRLPTLSPADVHERYATLFAAYTPGQPALFGDLITPVNVLPTLFDAYLGTALPRQPDRLIDPSGKTLPNPDLDGSG